MSRTLKETFVCRIIATLLAASALGLVATTAQAATDDFSAAVDVSPSGAESYRGHVVLAADGTATVTYDRELGPDNGEVDVRVRPPGGPLGPLQPLSVPGAPVQLQDSVSDPRGGMIAIWSRRDPTSRLQGRRLGADGTLGPVQEVSGAVEAWEGQLAIDGRGRAVAVWSHPTATGDFIVQAREIQPDGTLGQIKTLSAPSASGGGTPGPQIAVDAVGNALVVWRQYGGIVQARGIGPDGKLGPVEPVTPAGEQAYLPRMAMDGQGNTLVTWERLNGGAFSVRARMRDADGTLGQPQDISAGNPQPSPGYVGMNSDSLAAVAWLEAGPSGGVLVRARRRDGDGTLGPIATLATQTKPGFSSESRVGVDQAGQALIAWSRFADVGSVVEARTLARDGTMGELRPLGAGNPRSLALNAAGEGALVTEGFDAGTRVQRLAGYDAAAPALHLGIPAQAERGIPLTLSSSALDTWSSISIGWSLGDGATIAGATVSHVYAHTGTYQVAATATDALGHAATATGTVRVVDTRAPAIRSLRVSPRRQLRPALRRRATLRYLLSEDGRARIAIQRRRGRRWARVATLVRVQSAGAERVRVGRRIPRGGKRAGSFRARVTVMDAAGNRSATKTVLFRTVKR